MRDQIARIVARLDADGGGVRLVEEGVHRDGGVRDGSIVAITEYVLRFRPGIGSASFGGGSLISHKAPP